MLIEIAVYMALSCALITLVLAHAAMFIKTSRTTYLRSQNAAHVYTLLGILRADALHAYTTHAHGQLLVLKNDQQKISWFVDANQRLVRATHDHKKEYKKEHVDILLTQVSDWLVKPEMQKEILIGVTVLLSHNAKNYVLYISSFKN